MPADSKWIDGIAPDQPVDLVARQVLECRLTAVGQWLPLAAEQSHEDVEYVHRLRVSTRRAVEALGCFATSSPPRYARSRRNACGGYVGRQMTPAIWTCSRSGWPRAGTTAPRRRSSTG